MKYLNRNRIEYRNIAFGAIRLSDIQFYFILYHNLIKYIRE